MYDVKVNGGGDDHDWKEKQPHCPISVIGQILMIIIYPAGLSTSLLLLVAIFRHKKICNEPWRWLIAHASLCIFMKIFFLFMEGLTYVYLLPSLRTPIAKYLEHQFWTMANVSLALIIAERYTTMRKDKWQDGGMAKRDVIISLAVFWFITLTACIINAALYGVRIGFMKQNGIEYTCGVDGSMFSSLTHALSFLWLVATTIVGLIASIVYARQKPEPNKKRDLIIPTIFICISIILLCISTILLFLSNCFVYITKYLSLTSTSIGCILFSSTWLIVWTRNGDIQWKISDSLLSW